MGGSTSGAASIAATNFLDIRKVCTGPRLLLCGRAAFRRLCLQVRFTCADLSGVIGRRLAARTVGTDSWSENT